ncbi:MAG: hypothetical protein Q9207_002557 [Kuettlingeria erythrocarpa]
MPRRAKTTAQPPHKGAAPLTNPHEQSSSSSDAASEWAEVVRKRQAAKEAAEAAAAAKPPAKPIADDSDELEVLSSTPAVFQNQVSQTSQAKRKRSDAGAQARNVRAKPTVLRDMPSDANGHPFDPSAMGTMPPHMAQHMARQMLAPNGANPHSQYGSQEQQPAKRATSSAKKVRSARELPAVALENAQQAQKADGYNQQGASQRSNAGLATSVRNPAVNGSAGASNPGQQFSPEHQQRLMEEARRRVAAGQGYEQGVNVARPSAANQTGPIKPGAKRQRGEEYLEDKAPKRQETSGRPHLPLGNVSDVPSKKARSVRAKPQDATRQPSGPAPYTPLNVQPYIPQQQPRYDAQYVLPNLQAYHPHQQPGYMAQSGSQSWEPTSYTEMLGDDFHLGLDDDPFVLNAEPLIPFGLPSMNPEVWSTPAVNGLQDDQHVFGDFSQDPSDLSVFNGMEKFVEHISPEAIATMLTTYREDFGIALEAPAMEAAKVEPVKSTLPLPDGSILIEQRVLGNALQSVGATRGRSEDGEGTSAVAAEECFLKKLQTELGRDNAAPESIDQLTKADQKRSKIGKKLNEQKTIEEELEDLGRPLPKKQKSAPPEPPKRPPYVRPEGVLAGSRRDLQLQDEYILEHNLRAQLRK